VSGATVPYFEAVSARSSNGVWAVGAARVGRRPVPAAAHWNGRALRVLRPFAQAEGSFADVAAVSSRDVWAVGYLTANAVQTPLIAHWNGSRWSRVATRALGVGALSGIAALPGGQVWVVGRRRVRVSVSDPARVEDIERPFVCAGKPAAGSSTTCRRSCRNARGAKMAADNRSGSGRAKPS
jgi:hypothetical protein